VFSCSFANVQAAPAESFLAGCPLEETHYFDFYCKRHPFHSGSGNLWHQEACIVQNLTALSVHTGLITDCLALYP
jgi:hypothetical protein